MENKDMPAFPDTMRGAPQTFSNQCPEDLPSGLTKREYLAALIDVSKDIDGHSISVIQAVVGRDIPTSPFENLMFWAEAEAKLRVIKADALLTELSKPQP
jgi:hypothetical protein